MLSALSIEEIEWKPQFTLHFANTDDLTPPAEIVGQRRAVAAMTFGLEIAADGYNLFVMGEEGSGRRRLVRQRLEEAASKRKPHADWCYVDNFDEHRTPNAIKLPPGKGAEFKAHMSAFVSDLQEAIRTAFQGEEYRTLQQLIDEEFREQNEAALREVEQKATSLGLAMMRMPTGFTFAPVKDGQVMQPDAFAQLPEAQREEVAANARKMESELQKTLRQVPGWTFAAREKVRALNQRTGAFALDFLLEKVRPAFVDIREIQDYLAAVREDVLKNIDLIISELGAPKANSLDELINGHPFYRRYLVNLIVGNSGEKSAPVVFEDDPTLERLLGTVEHRAEQGTLQTDFHLIRPGALHLANGGYLVLDARKVLTRPACWEALKRSLYSREIRIQTAAQALGLVSTITLDPEPIPLDVKLVLIGERNIYYLLADADPEFSQLFKIAVDWEDSVRIENGDGDLYVRLIAAIVKEAQMLSFTRDALSHVLRYSARQAGDRGRYTMELLKIRNLLQESDYLARKRGSAQVDAQDVSEAIRAQIDRLGRIPELVRETINQGTIAIDTQNAVIGQINGLSVSQIGALSFGRPSRITARVGLGRGEFIDIEREVAMGGPTHSKGVLILTSFLRAAFGVKRPLSLRASLVFEQSYGGIDGDSASIAETCALISAIAQVPINQHFAVTGSINQLGQVQAIGGVNDKLEGYFAVCEARGLDGKHGAIIPRSNLRHLVLQPNVVEAVRAGYFHIFAASTVQEVLEVLTGMKAGAPDANGSYPADTLFGHVEQRLTALDLARRAADVRTNEAAP